MPIALPAWLQGWVEQSNGSNECRVNPPSITVGLRMALSKERGHRVSCGSSLSAETGGFYVNAIRSPLSSAMASSSPTGLGRADRCHNMSIRLPIARPVLLEGMVEQSNGSNECRVNPPSITVGLRMALSKERGHRVSCGSSLFAEAATAFLPFFQTNCSRHCKKRTLAKTQRRKECKDNKEIDKAVVGAATLLSGEKPRHPKNFLAFLASWRE